MNITVCYTTDNELPIAVKQAKYIGDYAIRIVFNTNEEKLVDFKPFLTKTSHPALKKYLNETLFASYVIDNGNLNWNQYDMIFPVTDLYNNNIVKAN